MRRFVSAAAIGVALLALYMSRLDDVGGLYVDDAYYVVLAQALSRGQGYALISSATTPILPAFPPGFALLLAPIVAVTSPFPANIAALKAVSILAMLGVAALTYFYMARYRGVDRGRATTIATITAILPGFVFLATSTVMAECVFTLALVAAVTTIEHAARDSAHSRRALVFAAAISTAAWLIRSAGVAPVLAGAAYLAWRRGWRAGAGFLAICMICYTPWLVYARAHQPSEDQRAAHGGSIVYSYGALLSMQSGGDATSGTAGAGELFRRVSKNLANVFGRDMGAVIFPAAYRGAGESGQEVFQLSGESGLLAGSMGRGTATVVTSSVLSVFVLIGWLVTARRSVGVAEVLSPLTIAMVILVPTRTFRYVLPVAPFLVGYFLEGIESAIGRWRGIHAAAAAFRIASACLLVLLFMEHGQYIAQKVMGPLPAWIEDGRDVRSVTDWMSAHLPPGATVAATNPGLVYLLTGHKTVALVDPLHNWQRWKDLNIRYLAALHVASKPGNALGYKVLYESPRLGLWILDLTPQEP